MIVSLGFSKDTSDCIRAEWSWSGTRGVELFVDVTARTCGKHACVHTHGEVVAGFRGDAATAPPPPSL